MSKKQVKTPLIYALEPRLLFDGDLGADIAASIVYRDGNGESTPAVAPENQRENVRSDNSTKRYAVVIIDSAVNDHETLVNAAPVDAEVHVINGEEDGFDQIAALLENHKNIDELHIFGHGLAGEARLGTASLSLPTLTTHGDTLAVLKNTLAEDGDILLYGCDIAEGEEGRSFIEELAAITSADIAASDDITGAGGDWELEVTTGPIETQTIIINDYLGRLTNGVFSTDNVTEAHSATDLKSGSGHAGDGLGIQITQEETGIKTDADLNFNLGSNLTNDADLELDSYLVYRNASSGNSGDARIVFDNGIAGINWVDWRTDDSGLLDAQFAKADASYDYPQGRGLESGDRQNVSFSGRALNITGNGLAGDVNGDYMRVFVYSSPAAITAVDDAENVSESVKVEAGSYQAAANIDLTTNDTTTSSSKRVVGLGSASDNIDGNPSHLDIGSLGLSPIVGVYGELRVASDNSISYWITNDADLETELASNTSVTETFYYRVANEFGSEDDGEITITINQANDRPVANPYTITRDYDASGFTVGTASSDHPLVAGSITDADDNGSFVLSGIHEGSSSAITLSDAASSVTLTDFGTVTVNSNDELVFTPDAALADLPQGQSLSRSFIYFVSDDGGAYNEGSDGVDRSDKITITINGTASIQIPQFKDQNQQVAKLYFQKNNTTTSSGNPLSSQRFNVLNDTRFAHSSNPSAHGESNLLNGDLINDIWTISGAGNTLEFGGWTSADGTADPVNATASEKQGVTTNSPHFSQGSGQLEVGNSNYFNFDDTLGEGDTGTYTWYYRVNVVNNGSIISSDIGQLDIILEGINDVASTVTTGDPTLYDKTNSGQGDRITTAVTASKNLDISITDPDAGDTTTVQRIRLYARLAGSYPEKNEALDALEGSEFFLNRGESTDDSDWEHSDAWGVLSDHFVITFNSDGTLDYVSKRDAYRSSDGDFTVYVASWTEHVGGVDSVQTNIDRTGSIQIRNIEYSANNVEFVDDAVAVSAVGSGTGTGSVAFNDNFFASLESFQRSTGSSNVRVAVNETIIGEYVTLTMYVDGSYSYTLNQEAFHALGDGETASESFTYWGARNPNAGDEVGQATLTFNFTGLADAFLAEDDTARVVTGATISGSSGDLGNQSSVSVYESSGTLISNDINDVGDLTVVGVWLGQETINATPTTIPSGGNVQVNGTYGVLTIYANGGYDYVANSGVTSEVIEYFTYTARNGDGEDDTAELAITIVPATDNEFVVEDLSHTMTDIGDEAGLTKTVTIANLLTHDANAIRSGNEAGANYAITGYAAGDSGSGFSNVGDTIRGTYGTLTINAAGVPTYVFDRPYSLQYEETGYDVFTFEVTDGRGSSTTNTAQLTVQINGLNTTPSWSDDAAITITEDTGVILTKYGDLAEQGSNNATGYNTALTGGWANYLEDEFGDVEGYQISRFDNVTVDQSSYDTTEGWTSWRSGSGNFQDTTIGSATNQNSILIGSVPFRANNTNDQITIDNTIQVGQSDVFNVSGELTGNTNIRGTFEVTVIGVQNTPVVDLDDDSASEPALFRFGSYYQGSGSSAGIYPDNTLDLFANDTIGDNSNIERIEISANGTSGWTAISQDNDGNAAPGVGSSILSGADFYWRGDKGYAGESYIEFLPSGFEALPAGDDVTGSFYYRIVEVDGTTSSAAQVSATLTPTDDPPEVHRQGAVLAPSGISSSITVSANAQPNWSNGVAKEGVAKPPSGVSTRYIMGNNGDDGDGDNIRGVGTPGEHTGGLLNTGNLTSSSADPENNSVILSVTPRYMNDATTSELSGLGSNSSTSVTLRGNHGELTVDEDGSYSYTADLKPSLNWSWSSSYNNYDYVDSFDIELGPAGVSGAGSVTTTLDIFFDGNDVAPVAGDDTAHVREDANISVSGNAAASTAGGDDDNAVDAPGEHSGNLLANDTDVNPDANLKIIAAGTGNTLFAMSLGTEDNPYGQITGTYGTLSIYRDGSYTYVADQDAADVLAAGETSNDVFRYRISDNNNDYGHAYLTITVHGAGNESYDREVETLENQTYDFIHTIVGNEVTQTDYWTSDEVDSNYNPPIEITSLPHSGTLRLGETEVVLESGRFRLNAEDMGNLNYVPPEDINGDDFTFFTYEILVDGQDMSDVTVTMTIDIRPANSNTVPTAVDDTINATSGTPEEGSVLENDSDPDGTTPSVEAFETGSVVGGGTSGSFGTPLEGTYGALTLSSDGTYTYTVDADNAEVLALGVGDELLTETFVYTITDGTDTDTAVITVNVSGVNNAPVAVDDTINAISGTPEEGSVLENDSDPDGTTPSVEAFETGSTVGGGTAGSFGTPLEGTYGTLTLSSDGTYTYTVDADNAEVLALGAGDEPLTETFVYTITDGTDTDTAVITVNVSGENNAPVAVDDTINATSGTPEEGSVLENDSDPDGTTPSVEAFETGSVVGGGTAGSFGTPLEGIYGTLTLNSDGTYTYTVDADNAEVLALGAGDEPLTETFVYTITDGTDTDTAVIMVNVSGVNNAPVAVDDTINATSGTPEEGSVLENDSDPDGTTPSVEAFETGSVVGGGTAGSFGTPLEGTYGALTLNSDGTYTYTVDADNAEVLELGVGDEPLTETFVYTITDGTDTDTAVITVNVSGANNAPVAVDDTINATSGTPEEGSVLENDSDPDGTTPSVEAFETGSTVGGGTAGSFGTPLEGTYGALTLNSDGTYTYTVDAVNAEVLALGVGDEPLTETFVYTITDGTDTDTAVITVNVSGVNNRPVAEAITETRVKTDNDVRIDLITAANASDVDDGDTLTVINDGDRSDDEPSITFSRSGTTRLAVGVDNDAYTLNAQRETSLTLNPGRTYIFDWSEHSDHPLRLSEVENGTHFGGGSEYTNGVTVDTEAGTTTIVVADGMPALYVYCENHSNMGFSTPVADYALPENAYSLEGGILTVSPRAFSDLASDNRVEIEVTYTIADGDVTLDTTNTIQNTAMVTITGLNTMPQIIDNYNDGDADNDEPNVAEVTTEEDSSYTFTLDDFNYVDEDNDELDNVLIIQVPGEGQLTLNGDPIEGPQRISRADIENGRFVYTPPENENGDDYTRFTYRVNDGTIDSDVGAMTINVNPVNDAPTSENRFIPIKGDMPVVFQATDFAFDDIDGDVIDYITIRTLPEKGTLYLIPDDVRVPSRGGINSMSMMFPALELDPSWEIGAVDENNGYAVIAERLDRIAYVADEKTSDLNYDSFTFTVNDGSEIDPQNLDSVSPNAITFGQLLAANRTFIIQEDAFLDTRVGGNGLGISGDDVGAITNLVFSIDGRPSHGALEMLQGGDFIFRPNANYFDTDTDRPINEFEYTVSVGNVVSDPGKITIIVEPQNDRPEPVAQIRNQLLFPNTEIRPIPVSPESMFGDTDRYDPTRSDFDNFAEKPEAAGSSRGTNYETVPAFGDLSYAITGLPEGLRFEGGAIRGKSSEAGRHEITITATDGGDLSNSISFFLDIANPVIEQIDKVEVPDLPERKIEKPEEDIAKLNDHDLPPLLRVNTGPTGRAEGQGGSSFEPIVTPELASAIEGNAGLDDDGWMNSKISSEQDISGNIRIIDLKVENKEISVQITDEAVDRAERFKGEMADGSRLPNWIKVDPNTGLTTAEPPAGAAPIEMRVVAEDGAGNARAIDLVLDPSTITNNEAPREANPPVQPKPEGSGQPLQVAVETAVVGQAELQEAVSALADSIVESAPRFVQREITRTEATVNVLADGRVRFGDATIVDGEGTLKLMRMVSQEADVKIEITDDARETSTQYQVRQKDGSAAPDWVQVNVQTGELTITAPGNMTSIELTLVANDGGEQRSIDLELDLEELREQEEGEGEDAIDEVNASETPPLSAFQPLDAQIDAALAENSYGRDIQLAFSERG